MTAHGARPRLRSLLLPTEHGGWGLSLEPGVLGLMVAPGAASLGLAVFALFAFLADRPLRVVIGDLRRRRMLVRTRWAAGVAAGYLVAAAAGLTVAALDAAEPFWWVLAAASPLVLVGLALEARGRTRSVLRELAGPWAIAAVAAAAAVAAGDPVSIAGGLWVVLAVRVGVSVMLVRAQIRASRGHPPGRSAVAGAHLLGLAVAAGAAAAAWASWWSVAAIGVLGAWAAVALSRPPMRVVAVGISQLVLGAIVVVAAAVGYPPA